MKKLGYVSLFSSAGIGCYGFKQEGFDCVATLELIERRLNIQKYNDVCSLKESYISGDIAKNEIKKNIFKAIDNWKKTYNQKEVEVVVATPPCQGISIANHKKNNELGRNSLIVESIKVINEIYPRFFVMENVRGFLNTICTDTDGNNKQIKEAIYENLGGKYNIAFKVLNFKEYGSHSSRTRTLVIGVRKDVEEITPYDLFPEKKNPMTLKELIYNLPRLKNMGEIDKIDIFHSFRPYKTDMLEWIKDIKEGQSAFDNKNPMKRPHTIINGKVIENQNKNGDKYTRCYWNKIAPCVHTRNDILSSQSTIHPEDNRVFSIRELMRFMTIPDIFNWSNISLKELNALENKEKVIYLKKNEVNIRQCIGEAVPTIIFRQIAQNILASSKRDLLPLSKVKSLIKKNGLKSNNEIINFIKKNNLNFCNNTRVAEIANAERLKNAAFYTRQDICFSLVNSLPDFSEKNEIKILEPSVGVGNFLPTLINKYKDIKKVYLDLIDIDVVSLNILKVIIKKIVVPNNFIISFINDDFLKHKFNSNYDLIVGNPPFDKIDKEKISEYRKNSWNKSKKTNNIFVLFIEKALSISENTALFSPKSLLNAPEFNEIRKLIEEYRIDKIIDYGEKGFKGVKIETISLIIKKRGRINNSVIESYPLQKYKILNQNYIINKEFPYWLIYRNKYFDNLHGKLNLSTFKALRDRTITKKNTNKSGKIKVIKSRNIEDGKINYLDNDRYIDNYSVSPVAVKYFNKENVLIVPNLSYYPRGAFLPKNSIVDGSAVVLINNENIKIDVNFFASKEFFIFYRIARNYSTRSLNVDSNSVYFWGLPKEYIKYTPFKDESRSKFLFVENINQM